jgi:hypothetical protein
VLEATVGVLGVLPVDARIGTRRPTGIVLRRTEPNSSFYAQFSIEGVADGPRMFDTDSIRRRLLAENNVKGVSSEPINVTFAGPRLPDAMLVDTSGFCALATDGADVPDNIVRINRSLLEDKRNVIVLVESASVDEMTQKARAEVYRADPNGDRLLIVKTKFDLTKSGDDRVLLETLQNKPHPRHNPHPPKYGVIGVRCRTHKEAENDTPLPDVEKAESRFMHSRGWLDPSKGVVVGVPALRNKFTEICQERIAEQIPEVLPELDRIIDDRKRQRRLMTDLLEQKDVRVISSELEAVANEFNRNSDGRIDLERRITDQITQGTEKVFMEATQLLPPDFTMTPAARQVTPTSYFNDAFLSAAAGLLALCKVDRSPPKAIPGVPGVLMHSPATMEGFRGLTLYAGHGAFDNVTNRTLESVQHAVVQCGAASTFVRVQRVEEYARRARATWIDSVQDRVALSLDKLGYVDRMIEIFLHELKESLTRVKFKGKGADKGPAEPTRLGILFFQEASVAECHCVRQRVRQSVRECLSALCRF